MAGKALKIELDKCGVTALKDGLGLEFCPIAPHYESLNISRVMWSST
jgi:hypothetical protein